ncbi:MAG: ATP-binding protein [Pseudomonadota bacterium]
MITRTLELKLSEIRRQFPAIAILGPRQSGKTTLAKKVFPNYRYVNLESLEERAFALDDPKGFMERFKNEPGVILDEIQKAPHLLSYIQVAIDAEEQPGRFILTGSQNILLNHGVSQTLAGRVALMTLLPFSLSELRLANALPDTAVKAIFQGFYPRIYQSHLDVVIFAESYIRTYIERDVRDIKQIIDLSDFQKFMRLCAARIGQLLNINSLATEAGISVPTVKAWLAVLEATYVIFLLQPYHMNFNKRVVKMPKLYFYDTTLACHLLRIINPDSVYEHYLKGGLFESMIISDLIKQRHHQGLPSNCYFWRDKLGNEIDVVQEEGGKIQAIEIKSSNTINSNLFDGLKKWSAISETKLGEGQLIYAGLENQQRTLGRVVSWRDI